MPLTTRVIASILNGWGTFKWKLPVRAPQIVPSGPDGRTWRTLKRWKHQPDELKHPSVIQNMGKYVKMVQLFGSTAVKGRDSLNSFNNYGKYFHLTLYVKNERVKPTFLYLGQKFNFLYGYRDFCRQGVYRGLKLSHSDHPQKNFHFRARGHFSGLTPVFGPFGPFPR